MTLKLVDTIARWRIRIAGCQAPPGGTRVEVTAVKPATATAIAALARRAGRPSRPLLRLALANLTRPGSPMGALALSLGLGLTVLVAVALIERNLDRQVNERLPERAPTFFFIDIQPDQAEAFDALVRSTPGASDLSRTPMIRGRVASVNGVPKVYRK